MGDISLETATQLHTALGEVLGEISSGNTAIDQAAYQQDELAAALRVRNAAKLETLEAWGEWMHTHRAGLLRWQAFQVRSDPYKDRECWLIYRRGSWCIGNGSAVNYPPSRRICDSKDGVEKLDQVDLKQIVKAWLLFAQKMGWKMPNELTRTPEGGFALYSFRQPDASDASDASMR